MRILLNGGIVQMVNGKCFPHNGSVGSISSKPKEELSNIEEVKTGGSIDSELARRLNTLNIKKPFTELQSRLLNVQPKKKLISFTI